MADRFSGKVAIVTGASRGVGRTTAEMLSREGATVIMTDINAEAGEISAKEIGSRATFVKQDVTDENGWIALIEKVEADHGRLDILVNNAAILHFADILSETLEGWQRLQKVNAESVFLGMRYAIPLMEKSGGGSIVSMSSSSALQGMPGFTAYSASKAAIIGLTQSVAVYCHQKGNGVRCNTVHPDGIATQMVAELVMPEAGAGGLDEAKAASAATYVCMPEDVANTILFLASDDSSRINGAQIRIDAGATITPPYV